MNLHHKLLDRYAAMAGISARMLAAARSGDWDAVIEDERRCRALVAELQALGDVALSPADLEAKRRIIRKLLAEDAEIRDLAQPWMRNLQALLSSSGNARKLDACYRT